mmetsp:Transcript_13540/g.44583  ORF Transcript_13540/g.44583 Transcript_13540/m.44583 type:complete len:325 (+) Transcript_13540:1364-2338(+)
MATRVPQTSRTQACLNSTKTLSMLMRPTWRPPAGQLEPTVATQPSLNQPRTLHWVVRNLSKPTQLRFKLERRCARRWAPRLANTSSRVSFMMPEARAALVFIGCHRTLLLIARLHPMSETRRFILKPTAWGFTLARRLTLTPAFIRWRQRPPRERLGGTPLQSHAPAPTGCIMRLTAWTPGAAKALTELQPSKRSPCVARKAAMPFGTLSLPRSASRAPGLLLTPPLRSSLQLGRQGSPGSISQRRDPARGKDIHSSLPTMTPRLFFSVANAARTSTLRSGRSMSARARGPMSRLLVLPPAHLHGTGTAPLLSAMSCSSTAVVA